MGLSDLDFFYPMLLHVICDCQLQFCCGGSLLLAWLWWVVDASYHRGFFYLVDHSHLGLGLLRLCGFWLLAWVWVLLGQGWVWFWVLVAMAV